MIRFLPILILLEAARPAPRAEKIQLRRIEPGYL